MCRKYLFSNIIIAINKCKRSKYKFVSSYKKCYRKHGK